MADTQTVVLAMSPNLAKKLRHGLRYGGFWTKEDAEWRPGMIAEIDEQLARGSSNERSEIAPEGGVSKSRKGKGTKKQKPTPTQTTAQRVGARMARAALQAVETRQEEGK